MPKPYICTVPYAPPSFNVYDRWPAWKKRAAKRDWQMALSALLNEKGNKAPRGLERVELRAVVSFPVVRGRDKDNYSMPLWKWSQDQLVRSGVLVDDTAERCHAMAPALIVADVEQTVIIVMDQGGDDV